MSDSFIVERIALHLVDKDLSRPQFSTQEIRFATFTPPEDVETLHKFFSGHLKRVWQAEEGRKTCAARFAGLSDIQQYYTELTTDASQFFPLSCRMAQRLYDVSRGRRVSRGLLMVLWFRTLEDNRQFLALFKMDPGRSNKIALSHDHAGNVLLELAVRHIEQALPDPDHHLLKWAVIPHPTRPAFDVKVADEESGADPAQYFLACLGCEIGISEKRQLHGLLDALPAYAQEYHASEDWTPKVQEMLEKLQQAPAVITPTVVVEAIQESNVFTDFHVAAFQEKLASAQAGDLNISPETLRATKVQYRLPSGITISGLRARMENLVRIESLNGEYEFRIRTPSYKRSYVS